MDRTKRFLKRTPSYEPIDNANDGTVPGENRRPSESESQPSFSFIIYTVFLLLGVAMLWPWNSFMSAAPYFQIRFRSSKSILSNFQAAELSVSTVTNLTSVWVLAKLQAGASYPKRIISSLLINTVAFSLVAISTKTALDVSPGVYLAFLIVAVLATSMATGFMQNGSFAYVAGYQRPEYMQSIMFGQAVAGVLPPIVQISSVLSPSDGAQESGESASASAFAYFLAAMGVSAATLVAFFFLLATYRPTAPKPPVQGETLQDEHSEEEPLQPEGTYATSDKKSAPLTYLARRLFFSATAVFLTFGITMVFPVFTQEIFTTNPNPPPLLKDASFIPLGLLVWNIGDLAGRLVPLAPQLSLANRPRILFALSIMRVVFIPLYMVCNIIPAEGSPGAALSLAQRASKAMPDAFYLFVVQLPFGLSNGYLGSCCMMGAGNLVEDDEREAAGAFMGLVLVAGLAVGSFCSFFVGNG